MDDVSSCPLTKEYITALQSGRRPLYNRGCSISESHILPSHLSPCYDAPDSTSVVSLLQHTVSVNETCLVDNNNLF